MTSLEELIERQKDIAIQFEQYLYRTSDHHSEDYNGGSWESVSFDDTESFVLLMDNNTSYKIRNSGNFAQRQIDEAMDSKTFSLSMFCMAANIFGLALFEDSQKMYSQGRNEQAEHVKEFAKTYFDMSSLARSKAPELLSEDGLKNFYVFID
jgi:hypothetical protein